MRTQTKTSPVKKTPPPVMNGKGPVKTQAKPTRAVAVAQKAQLPALPQYDASEDEGLQTRNALISKLWLMQGQSDFVLKKAATVGEIRDSLSGELLGSTEQPLEFVALLTYDNWAISQSSDAGRNFEYQETIAMTPENADMAWEEVDENNAKVITKRQKQANFYVLLMSELEQGKVVPRVITFRGMSYKAARKLTSYGLQLKAEKKPLRAKAFVLSAHEESKNDDNFFVYDVSPSEQEYVDGHPGFITADVYAQVDSLFLTLKKSVQAGTVRVDDKDVKAEATYTQDATAQGEVEEGSEY